MNDTMNKTKQQEIVCIVCPNGCRIQCDTSGGMIACTGQKCKRGEAYAAAELTHPMRTLTTSVKTDFPDSPVVSVRTDGEIEKSKLGDVIRTLGEVRVHDRVKIGDVVVEDVCHTGVNIICTSDRLVHPY